jgi:hypothetical protein
VSDIPAVPEPTLARDDWADVLDSVASWLAQFVAYPHEHALRAHALWITHTHFVDVFENSPRIAFLSPEPGSGKSRALEVTEPLVVDPVLTVNVSVAYLFRRIAVKDGQHLPTVLFDEADSVFVAKASENTEAIRGLLNSGYRRGASVGRVVVRGRELIAEEWPSFCPVALAGLGDLPDTLMTRAIVVRMRRRGPGETVMPYRRRVFEAEGAALRDRLTLFATDSKGAVGNARPHLPDGIEDRNADIWEPLIAVADAAGGEWPDHARDAASFMIDEQSHKPATLSIQLLSDIRLAFDERRTISTNELLDILCQMETAPWGTMLKGQRIDSRYLARRLTRFDVSTNNTVRMGAVVAKGYAVEHLADAWARYLPPLESSPEMPEPLPLEPDDEPF